MTWIKAAEAVELLGRKRRTLDRYAQMGRIRVRRDPHGRGRLFNRDDLVTLKAGLGPGLDKKTHNRAAQRALWRLSKLHTVDYLRLRAEELAKERGSPAATGNPPTSTHSQSNGKAGPV